MTVNPPKSAAPPDVDAAAYNRVVGRTALSGIRMLETRFDLKPEATRTDPTAWRTGVTGTVEEAFNHSAEGRLIGIFRYEAIFRHGRKRVMTATARYLVSYRIEGECDDAIGKLFVERVGRVVAYPYFRSMVASLASQAAVALPPLPIISLAPRSVTSAADLEESPVRGLAESGRDGAGA